MYAFFTKLQTGYAQDSNGGSIKVNRAEKDQENNMKTGKIINRKKEIIAIVLIFVYCVLLFHSPKCYAEGSQEKGPIIISTPSMKFTKDVLNEAFPDNITQSYHTYILIKILPSFYPESQIMIGLKANEQRAQASFRHANISLSDAFRSEKQHSDAPKVVAKLMDVQQKDTTIPMDIALKWISEYWANLETAIYQIRNKPDVLILDGTRYVIEIYTLQNKITLEVTGPDLTGKYNHYDIASMLDWISPIIEYVKNASMENDIP